MEKEYRRKQEKVLEYKKKGSPGLIEDNQTRNPTPRDCETAVCAQIAFAGWYWGAPCSPALRGSMCSLATSQFLAKTDEKKA